MKYGIHLPNFGPFGNAHVLADLAKDAEDAGWDGFFIWDHVNRAFVFDNVDPWVALAAMAMNTSIIKIGAHVTPTPRRRPWNLARETVSVDHLSGGRLIFGFGIGSGAREEWDIFDEETNPKVRGEMLDEGLAILIGLWTGDPFSFKGNHYKVEETQFIPKPVQSPRIPLWGAGVWPKKAPFRRAARFDGIYPILSPGEFSELEQFQQVIAFMKSEQQVGSKFDFIYMADFQKPQTWDQVNDQVAQYAEAGATWWIEEFMPSQFDLNWDDPWPVDALKDRIAQGPPTFE